MAMHAALEAKAAARELRVWFTADVAPDMPWNFKPTQVAQGRIHLALGLCMEYGW